MWAYIDITRKTIKGNKVSLIVLVYYRVGQRLNIAHERTPAEVLFEVINKLTRSLHLTTQLENYTTTESSHLDKFTGIIIFNKN